MASTGTSILSESLNASCMSNYEWQYQLEDLPNELLTLILGYLPLSDLAKTRLVSLLACIYQTWNYMYIVNSPQYCI